MLIPDLVSTVMKRLLIFTIWKRAFRVTALAQPPSTLVRAYYYYY